ncbi:MAG TPA: M56 family metallopeptidase [Bacteroidales bacterium]|nr:M56 family metallopeptidase [Bacteroidales bacterium]
MDETIRYLLMSGCSLACFYTVYWLFMRRDTTFRINRIYLLAATIISFACPFVPVHFQTTSPLASMAFLLDPVIITPEEIRTSTINHIQWLEIVAVIYLTGVFIFTVRFLFQLIQLLLLIRRTGITRRHGMRMVIVDRGYSPFSFFHLLFIRSASMDHELLPAVIEHEKVHMRQWHSADLILMELTTIIQWFNPFAWMMQRSVKTVHEYLADEGVLRQGIGLSTYRRMIFNHSLGIQLNTITNHFNVSLIKSRIIMMTKSRSVKMAGLKAIVALPVFFAVLFFFSSGVMTSLSAQEKTIKRENPDKVEAVEAQEKTAEKEKQAQVEKTQEPKKSPKGNTKDIKKVPDFQPEFPGGFEAMSHFLSQNIKYPKDAMDKKQEGKVFVNFVVEEDGTLSNFNILRGIGGSCDEEALRVSKLMPKWEPARMKNGKKVAVQMTLPINFKLDGKKVPPAQPAQEEVTPQK